MTFVKDQFVIAPDPETNEDSVATIAGPNAFGGFELGFLRHHRVGSGRDISISCHPSQMRAATHLEIIREKRAWEVTNNHKLNFTILDWGDGCLCISDQVELSITDAETICQIFYMVGEHIAAGGKIVEGPDDGRIYEQLQHQLARFTMSEAMGEAAEERRKNNSGT